VSFSDDLTTMLGSPFAVSATSGGTTANGLLMQPSQVALDGMVLFTDYTFRSKASDFGSLVAGASITVDGTAYTVRETRLLNDGLEVEISIQKS
jgi:hypothetical protein